jgi:hypothetical protein
MMLTMLYILPLLGGLLLGLALLATGVIFLLKVKNKIAGVLVIALGGVFILCPLAVYLALTVRIHG